MRNSRFYTDEVGLFFSKMGAKECIMPPTCRIYQT